MFFCQKKVSFRSATKTDALFFLDGFGITQLGIESVAPNIEALAKTIYQEHNISFAKTGKN
mgnify:CR=1 FL=1